MKKQGVDLINYMAIELLEQFHIYEPTQVQIDMVESFIRKVILDGRFIFDNKLNQREVDCLYWAAKGKSSKETANILCISSETVDWYRKQIKEKLECKNIAHAVFQGMKYACLCPP